MRRTIPQNFLLFVFLLILVGSPAVLSSLGWQDFPSILSIGRVTTSYLIFKEGDLIKAKNVLTGAIDFQGADATEVISRVIYDMNVSGGGVLLINSSLQLGRQIVLDSISNIKIVGIHLPTLAFKLPLEDLGSDKGVSLLIRNSNNITIERIDFFYDSDRTAKHIKFRFVNKGIVIRNSMFRSRMPPQEPQPESYFVPHDSIALSPADAASGEHLLEDFTFEGNYASGSAVDFIAIHNVRNFVIRDNFFIDAAARRWDKMIGNVTNAIGGNSITITGENGIISKNVFIRKNQPEIFYGSYVKHMGGILLTYVDSLVARDIIVSNNVFNGTKMGIALDAGMENITITGNVIYVNASRYGREDGIAVRSASKSINITLNRVFKPYRNGIVLAVKSSDCLVDGNFLEYAQREGIRIEGNSTNHYITNNIVKNNGQDLSLSLTDARRAGIGVRGINITIIGNIIFDDQSIPTQTFGMAIELTALKIFIEDNYTYGNVTADIRNLGEDVVIKG